MQTATLEVTPRNLGTKNELGRMRKNGEVPAVLYGRHIENSIKLSFSARTFSRLLSSFGKSSLITFESKDSGLNGRSALIKEIQKDCINDMFVHVDLLEVTQGEKIHTTVSIEFVGTPVGTKEGGVVDYQKRELDIECLPTDIPNHLVLNIEKMQLNDVMHVSDIVLPEGVKIMEDANLSVVSVRIVKEKAPSVEGVEPSLVGEEGEEGVAAAAAAPAAEKTAEKADKAEKTEKSKKD
ncbi:MAG: 50S ribosomal protein L25 [Oligoflexia bacterium]|nr:50S ribosomal protein L25 [Oligoflexia bacterium]